VSVTLTDSSTEVRGRAHSRAGLLILSALGIVFGDIGTSPLYALRECFAGTHSIPVSQANVLGVLSLIFWSLILTVSVKYLLFVMRADNGGEGGILALVALLRSKAGDRLHTILVAIGLFGAALLYGDGMITPAISVLSAVEGLQVATTVFEPFVVPITVVILIGLFFFQHRGTAGIGRVFGPIMIVWFLTITILGLPSIFSKPVVLASLSPTHAVSFFSEHGLRAFLTLGAVFLSVTGAEALYADMGHFGRAPIRTGWFAIVLPALVINYLGQGALLLSNPDAQQNPFYGLAPDWGVYPLVIVATIAAVIASQAVISGAFSLTQQAVQLGYAPRFDVQHTSEHEKGQVYIPEVNWLLMFTTVGLVFGFRSSTNLAAAYGMAVTTTMVITTLLAYVVARERWLWGPWRAGLVTAVFLGIDLAFFGANLIKIQHGGWFPLLVAAGVYTVMSTWKTGREYIAKRLAESEIPLDTFFKQLAAQPPVRIGGTGVFMTGRPQGAPPILVHHLKHNKVLHTQVVLLTVSILDVPSVDPEAAIEVHRLTHGFYRVVARYGFMQRPDVPEALASVGMHGLVLQPAETTYYLAHLTLFVNNRIGMTGWRDKLFIFFSRNARRATNFFQIPPDRVVEIGMQLEL
jgi:KUP system potassium uptake protein